MAAPQAAGEPAKRGRVLSFGSGKSSEKSHRSSGSGHRVSLVETHEEKARRNLQTKADPTVAMYEAQPAAVALEKSNLGTLRGMQFKDRFGNPITDPDRSNPTRHRFERPLDTIRSFEAAIDGSYNSRRASFAPTEDASNAAPSRRGSYFGGKQVLSPRGPNGGGNGHSNRGYDQGGYYGRGSQSRPDSYVDNHGGSNPQQYNSYYPYNNNNSGRQRQRSHYDQGHGNGYGNNGQNFYPQQGYQKSYDNVTAGSGSGSNTDQWGNSTDPSSVNSSMDRLQQQQQQERQFADSYGFNGSNAGPQADNGYAYNGAGAGGYERAVPAPVAKDPNSGGPVGGTLRKNAVNSSSDGGEKKKSWLKKRFSKS
ncbi:hypothetical protein VTN00DRAFT_7064 [Thermoascus crustaceus]|uniref:uncharacterized protein n=1 Tax=Thermoascus crustaceus TaxID=5088 RepID=UPI00374279BB